jgi:hypothetical protein
MADEHDGVSWYTGEPGPYGDALVCHGDFGPWNAVWRNGGPAGLLDWDDTHPANARHDVAYALEYVTPFREAGRRSAGSPTVTSTSCGGGSPGARPTGTCSSSHDRDVTRLTPKCLLHRLQ